MTIQTYRDVTFVFGPPSGDRYEMLKHVASKTGKSFCCVYQEYMGEIFDEWTKSNLLDKTFSAILGVGTQINRIFPSYQMRIDRKEECEKFYYPSSAESIRIPVLMLYPPEFTWESKDSLETKVEMNHLNVVSSILGQSLQLDWVAVHAALAEDCA